MTVVDNNTFTLTFSGRTWHFKQRFDMAGASFYEPSPDEAASSMAQQMRQQQACHNTDATAGFATAGLHNNISTAGFATARLPQQGFYSSTCHSGLGQRCCTSGRTFQSSWPKQIKKSRQHLVAIIVLDQCACFKTCPCFATIVCPCHNDTGLDLVYI